MKTSDRLSRSGVKEQEKVKITLSESAREERII
jgi:hypothetical protein